MANEWCVRDVVVVGDLDLVVAQVEAGVVQSAGVSVGAVLA